MNIHVKLTELRIAHVTQKGRISPACFLSEFFILMPVLFCLSEKFFRHSDKTSGIFHPGCLIRRMHRKLRKSDIYCIHRYLRIRNISQGRSARHIGAIHKGLVFYACPVAKILEFCR